LESNTLVFIPTYNEAENVLRICHEILNLNLSVDILFLDDNSPDGTGELIDQLANRYKNVFSLHRPGKDGIGSAHIEGISWAYSRGYNLLVTMDCDFSHPPSYIPEFVIEARNCDLVIGSRYLNKGSLNGWNLYRKSLTILGHTLTSKLLDMDFDASGAFRAYDLNRIKPEIFEIVSSNSYSFFFESLYIIFVNNYKIKEIPIHLPARTYGSSKMRIADIFASLTLLFKTYLNSLFNIEKYYVKSPETEIAFDSNLVDPQNWDSYWSGKKNTPFAAYDIVATIYRKYVIKTSIHRLIRKHFAKGSRILHAGCGSGQIDDGISEYISIHGLDISREALALYAKVNGSHCRLIHGDLLAIPPEDEYYDGIYNVGVMEHFAEKEILGILKQFNRVLKKGGKLILFWPPEYGLSVIFLKGVHFFLNHIMQKDTKLHPDELTRLKSKSQIEGYFSGTGFKFIDFDFGPRDLFTYAAVVAQKE